MVKNSFLAFYLIFLFFHFNIDATDFSSVPNFSMVGAPDSIVNGSVNVITGDYCEGESDFSIGGPAALSIGRNYISSFQSDSTLYRGWTGTHLGSLHLYKDQPEQRRNPRGDRVIPPPRWVKAIINDPSGAVAQYIARDSKKADSFILNMGRYTHVLTNCGAGEISGRTNIKNNSLRTEGRGYTLRLGDGGRRYYKQLQPGNDQRGKRNCLKLFKEVLPSGAYRTYEFDEKTTLVKKIHLFSAPGRKSYNTITYTWKGSDSVTISSSDGSWARYYFRKLSGTKTFYLYRVESSEKATVGYSYVPHGKSNAGKVCKKVYPDGRCLITEYYHPGMNDVGGKIVNITGGEKDFRLGRVKLQKAPVGPSGEMVTVARFFYHVKPAPGHIPGEGYTEVIDAKNNKKRYHFNRQQRLTAIEHFTGDTLVNSDRFLWGAEKSKDLCNLIGIVSCNEKGKALSSKRLIYDKRGNIIEERLYGNISGRGRETFSVNRDGVPRERGVECEIKKYRYSNDGMNLLLSQIESNGTRIDYLYKRGTNLMTAKFFYERKQCRLREFFTYDSDGCLVKMINDDGRSSRSGDLRGVTSRKIIRIKPSKRSGSFGMPEERSCYYLDFPKKKEVFLSRTKCSYNRKGQLILEKFFDARNKLIYSIAKDYDAKGNIIKIRDSRGTTEIAKYDANGNKIFSQGPHFDFYTKYSYDRVNRLIKQQEVHLDKKNFVQYFSYDAVGNQITASDIQGNKIESAYDGLGRQILKFYPKTYLVNGKGKEEVVRSRERWEYDSRGNIKAHYDLNGYVTKSRYNIHGKPIQINYSDGTQERFFYYLDGNLKRKIEKTGSYKTFHYDYKGRQVEMREYKANKTLPVVEKTTFNAFYKSSEIDRTGVKTVYRYDGAGRVREKISGYMKEKFSYDSRGNLSETKTFFGKGCSDYIVEWKSYDLFNRVVSSEKVDAVGRRYSKETFAYDLFGNCTYHTTFNQKGAATTHTIYDAHDRTIQTIDPLGNCSFIQYNDLKRNQLNQKVKEVSAIDSKGNRTISLYDALGRVVEVIKKDCDNHLLDKRTFHYDRAGNKRKEKHHVFNGKKREKVVVTQWKYGPLNRLEELVEAVGQKKQRRHLYRYDKYGRQVKKIKPNGVVISSHFDRLNRLTALKSSDETIHYQYSYDLMNRPIKVVDHIHKTYNEKIYDACGKVVKESLDSGLELFYSYDLSGRIIALKLPDGTGINYSYKGPYLATVVRVDAERHLIYRHQYLDYDLSGNRIKESLIAGLGPLEMNVDLLGRRVLQSSPFMEWQIPDKGYDALGNLLECHLKDKRKSAFSFYSYNNLNQLVKESGEVAHRYRHDSRNNRLQKDEFIQTIGPIDQLLADGRNNFSYDACGNPMQKEEGKNRENYSYDALGRLVKYSNSHGKKFSYTYDSLHRRVAKKDEVTGEEYFFIYQGDKEIGATDRNGKIFQLRILGKGQGAEIGAAIAIEIENKVYLPLHNHRGAVHTLVDIETRQVVESYQYSAFGEETIFDVEGKETTSSQVGNPWRYCSKRTDEETGYVYFGRRYYNAFAGRWLTPDPLGYDAGPNLYTFLNNNPLSYQDLYGLKELEDKQLKSGKRAKRRSRFFSNLLKAPGRLVEGYGRHVSISPWEKQFFQRCGRLMKGTSPFDELDYDRDRRLAKQTGYRGVIGKGEITNQARISCCLGQANSLDSTEKTMKNISDRHGSNNVHYICNTTQGNGSDTTRSAIYKLGIKDAHVTAMYDLFNDLIDEVGGRESNGQILHYCHSQGAIITYLALEQLDNKGRRMIEIKSLGFAQLIPNEFARYVDNYYSTYDPIPQLFGLLGASREGVNIHKLDPSSGAFPGCDHSINNKAYMGIITQNGKLFADEWGKW